VPAGGEPPRRAAAVTLADERVPFPVEPRYSVRPTLRRWSADDRGHLRLDRAYPAYLREKLRLLRNDPAGCRVLAPGVDRAVVRRALVRAAEALAADAASDAAAGAVEPEGEPAADQGRATGGAGRPAIVADREALRFPLLGVALARADLEMRAELSAVDVAGLPRSLLDEVRAHLTRLGPLERLADALALAVQEDLVLMAGPEAAGPEAAGPVDAGTDEEDPEASRGPAAAPLGGRGRAARRPGDGIREGDSDGRAELLHVCFPSSWDPAERAGAGFAALHAPVPHGETLQAAGGRLVRAMVAKGPFVRYVWSLAGDGALDRNPRRRAVAAARVDASPVEPAPADPSALWFRVERQTVLPLPELHRALFTIRVYRAPLPEVLTTPARRRTLALALRSMDAPLLAYKGVGGLRTKLLAYLERA